MDRYIITIGDRLAIKHVKNLLEAHNLLDKSCKITSDANQHFHIPITTNKPNPIEYLTNLLQGNEIVSITKKENLSFLNQSLNFQTEFSEFLTEVNLELDGKTFNELIRTFPKKYSIYPPLLLLPPKSLDTPIWQTFLTKTLTDEQTQLLFRLILSYFSTPSNKLTHLAINKPIPESNNEVRSPSQLTTLYGNFDNFWCHTVQNGIYQTWMPTKTMFSRGNIKEKARILNNYKDIAPNRDVVDLYAGIGYFTLSYLQRGARRTFCWEINPYSVDGLLKGVSENGYGEACLIHRNEPIDLKRVLESRCIVFLESNEFCLQRFEELFKLDSSFKLDISHVNLGLLPTSTASWPYACKLVDLYTSPEECSWLHVHENIGISDFDSFMDKTKFELQKLTENKSVSQVWLEKVKTFAPDVYHVVGDFQFNPI